MSNNFGTLEDRVYTVSELNGINTDGIKKVFTVDIANKRRSKKSTPTLILNALERSPDSSIKEIENRLASNPSVALKANYNTAKAVRLAKGFNAISLRDYVRDRIKKVFKYYLNPNVVTDVFSGYNPLIFTVDSKGIERYSLTVRLFPIAK